MDLQKIYTDADFSNAEIPEGQILTYLGTDESGNVVTRYKDSQGNVGTIAGSGGSNQPTVDVVAGYFINTDGEIAFKALDGTTESVQEISIVDTGVDEPDYNKCSEGGMYFYKCASVDTVNKTWTGYKAVLTDGIYSFEETVTEGLTYVTAYTPTVGKIYSTDATVQVNKLWDGTTLYTGLVFNLPMDKMLTTALTGQELTIADDVQATEYNGKKCFYMFSSDGITFPADDLSTDDYTVAISMARTHTDQIQTAFGYGERGSTGSTALIGVDHGDELFFGGYGVEVYGESMEQGKWYHGTVTKAGSQLTLYLNGKSVGAHSFVDALIQGIGYIGRNSDGSERFHGYLADAKIWNRALSEDEVMSVYQEADLPE